MRLLIFALLFLPLCAFAQGTSVCAISAHPSRFHNKVITVRAAAVSGMEAQMLMDSKDGKPDSSCGRIWLNLDSRNADATTQRFVKLFGEQLPEPPPCGNDALKGVQHALDPNVPGPPPCIRTMCMFCPRYNIVGTFTGRLRDSKKDPRNGGFGHLGQFRFQLDVQTVADLDVNDATLPATEYIAQAESDWAESVASHDCSVPERVMADDFIGVEVDGSQYNKPGSLQYCKTHPTNFASNHLGRVEVQFAGPDTAIARGYEDWTLKNGKSGRFYWTDTWLRRNGKWQVVAAEDLIAAPSPY